jgi:hypothetical protein
MSSKDTTMGKELTTPIPFEDFARRVRSVFDDVARKGRAVLVERDGLVYRLEPQLQPPPVQTADPHNIWANYDPVKVQEAFSRAVGLLRGVDTEQLKRDLLEQREQDSTGRPAD